MTNTRGHARDPVLAASTVIPLRVGCLHLTRTRGDPFKRPARRRHIKELTPTCAVSRGGRVAAVPIRKPQKRSEDRVHAARFKVFANDEKTGPKKRRVDILFRPWSRGRHFNVC